MLMTVKFGGSSLADANQIRIRKVQAIIQSDKARKFIVVSAPGARFQGDRKITDLLCRLYDQGRSPEEENEIRREIAERYEQIVSGLGLSADIDIRGMWTDIWKHRSEGRDYLISRGEYLMGVIMVRLMQLPFVDAADVIRFDQFGNFLPEETDSALKYRLDGARGAVIPGFYGTMTNGRICTFPRGGSDITGSIVAKAVASDVYENWTDVSGVLLADPRIVENPAPVSSITYHELHKLSSFGANVFQEDAVYPVKEAGIPIHIKNTNRPQDQGTVVLNHAGASSETAITGITGLKGLCVVHIVLTARAEPFAKKIYKLLCINGLSCKLFSVSGNVIAFLIPYCQWDKQEHKVLFQLKSAVPSGCYAVEPDLALIAVG